jgi:AraC-like DNA-binding protein
MHYPLRNKQKVRLRTIQPRPQIAGWIHHFWVFESAVGLPSDDARVVVPNGRPKLIIPWRNGLSATGNGVDHPAKEGEIVVIGVWDQPSTLTSPADPTVTIGVEFRPNGLSRFVDGDLDEIFQRILPLDAYLGAQGARLASRANSAETVEEAVDVVQDFLCLRAKASERPRVRLVDAALRRMASSGFHLDIADLADELGCSRRYLQDVFRSQIGLAPKRLQTVLAFEGLYRTFSQNKDGRRLRDDALDIYFDQAHFIRSFQGFTGYSPGRFVELENEFGRIFYR